MWTCPKCQRPFHTSNQSHMCNDITVDDIFAGKPEDLVLAFDEVLVAVMDWEPNLIGAASKAVVFTNKRAWLIVRPMSKLLELSFYSEQELSSAAIHKSTVGMGGKDKFRHSIRLSGPGEITPEIVDLLRIGYDFGMR